MTDAKHSPGPWIVKTCLEGGYDFLEMKDKDGRHSICHFYMRTQRVEIVRMLRAEANARLIAEAPAMFEAMERAIAFWLPELKPRYTREMESIVARINKPVETEKPRAC